MKHGPDVRDRLKDQLLLLDRGLELLGLSLSPKQKDQFAGYLSALLAHNAKVNLLSRGDVTRVAERHILESLAWLPRFDPELRAPVMDLGSGAGFPGIPLAILRPRLSVVLVESVGKKARFLAGVVEELDLNARVVTARAEHLSRDHHGVYGAVVARAVASIKKLVIWAEPLLVPGAPLLTFKGDQLETEIEALRKRSDSLIWGVERVDVPKDLEAKPKWQTRQILWVRFKQKGQV